VTLKNHQDSESTMRTPASSWITNGRNIFVHGNEISFGGRYTASLCHQPPEPGWAWGMILTADAKNNRLFAALSDAELARWLPFLEPVDLPPGKVLHESSSNLTHLYFPTTSIISLLCILKDGDSTEIAVVGNEGVVGISLLMGGLSTPSRAEVQSAGQGFRVKADLLMHEFNQSSSVRHFLLRYVQALITQMAQMAACYRHHSLDQQLCRWLLLRLDRLNSNQLVATQELIANLLGVRREGVTEAALRLQRAGLIRYRRGRITVLDRNALERTVCECYAVVKEEYDRLLPAKCEARHCRAGA
jgi:CRP-like cAMP-binding protein